VSEVRRLLRRYRLTTLTGMGGVGKTRLAVRAAARVREAFDDGVWLVELAPVADPALVVPAVANVLGVAGRSATSELGALIDHLTDKRLLLMLDSCEHLVDAVAKLVDRLLAAAPGLRVLTTSREALRIGGEHVVDVAPLATPDPGSLPPGDLREFEAVRLFAERARAVSPTFTVTAANRAVVAEVCHRLDGIPLAIELAAAWLRVLSVEQILTRLDDRFGLLTTGSPRAPARQQTLEATLDWSHGLCSPGEQVLWARVSVFAGGFDLQAADAVCAGDGIGPGEVLELVVGLVEKSILVRAPESGPRARYALLDTVRQYGWRRLVAAGRHAVWPARHRDYYRELARRAEVDRVSPREVAWLLRLRRELPNLRLAMECALAEPDAADTALQIAVSARDLWYGTGGHREGLRWLTRALARDPQPTVVRAFGLAVAGYLTLVLGDIEASRRMLAQARALADRLDDPAARAVVVLHLSNHATRTQPPDLTRALALAEQALTDARAVGDLRTVLFALLQATLIGALTADPRAAGHAEQCRALGEAHGAEWTTSWALTVLALVRWQEGDHEQAAALVHRALPVIGAIHDLWAAAIGLPILAWTAGRAGRHQYAARLLGFCHAVKRREGTTLAELGPFAGGHAACDRDARQALGSAAYTAAFDEGTHFTLDEAISHALGTRQNRTTPLRR
jgi:predicted ATPase